MLTVARPNAMSGTSRTSGSIRAVKEALERVEAGSDPRAEALDRAGHLALLAKRVRRLRRFGGEFAGVRFGPGVQRLRAALRTESCLGLAGTTEGDG